MQTAKRSILTVLAVLSAVVVTIASTLSLAVALAATALIVPGTGTPNANIVGNYLENSRDYYISPFNPACTAANDCDLVGINYPAQFWPVPLPGWGGLNGAKWDVSTGQGLATLNSTLVDTLAQNPPNTPIVIFGYSQGGNIVSREKRNLKGLPPDQTYLSFVMIGNANRPNGGLFERLAFLGHVPILDATFGLPAPTDTCDHICATDIAFRYDGVADFPLYPLNALAVLNAIAGFWYIHGTYLAPTADSDPGELPDDYTPAELAAELANTDNWQEHGDTRYITIPTRTLPIVRPFVEFGNFTGTSFLIDPLVALLSPMLRVLIETGYDRSLSFGTPAPFRLIPRINPITLAGDLIKALGEGIQAAFGNPAVQRLRVPGSAAAPQVPAPQVPAPQDPVQNNLAAAVATGNDAAAADTFATLRLATKDGEVVTAAETQDVKPEVPATPAPEVLETLPAPEAAPEPEATLEPKATLEPEAAPEPEAIADAAAEPAAVEQTKPVRPMVRGPIGSNPLPQLVKKFEKALRGSEKTLRDTEKTLRGSRGTTETTRPETTRHDTKAAPTAPSTPGTSAPGADTGPDAGSATNAGTADRADTAA